MSQSNSNPEKEVLQPLFTMTYDGLARVMGWSKAGVFCLILRFSNLSNGYCRASLDTMASMLGMSRRAVIDHKDALLNEGWILDETPDTRSDEKKNKKQKGKPRHYRVPSGLVLFLSAKVSRDEAIESIGRTGEGLRILHLFTEAYPDKQEKEVQNSYTTNAQSELEVVRKLRATNAKNAHKDTPISKLNEDTRQEIEEASPLPAAIVDHSGDEPDWPNLPLISIKRLPEIETFLTVTRRSYPGDMYAPIIWKTLRDNPALTRSTLQPFWDEWLCRGYNTTSLKWMTEWAVAGQIPDRQGAASAKGTPLSRSRAAVISFMHEHPDGQQSNGNIVEQNGIEGRFVDGVFTPLTEGQQRIRQFEKQKHQRSAETVDAFFQPATKEVEPIKPVSAPPEILPAAPEPMPAPQEPEGQIQITEGPTEGSGFKFSFPLNHLNGKMYLNGVRYEVENLQDYVDNLPEELKPHLPDMVAHLTKYGYAIPEAAMQSRQSVSADQA